MMMNDVMIIMSDNCDYYDVILSLCDNDDVMLIFLLSLHEQAALVL